MTKKLTKKQSKKVFDERVKWCMEHTFHDDTQLTLDQAEELVGKQSLVLNPLHSIEYKY